MFPPGRASPSPFEHLQRNSPTGPVCQPLLPSPHSPPQGPHSPSPLRPQQCPVMQSMPTCWEATQKQQPSVPVKQSSPGGDMALCNTRLLCPKASWSIAPALGWLSSGVLPAPQATGRGAPLPKRPEQAPSPSCVPTWAWEMRSDSSRSHGSRPEVRASGAQAVTPQRVDWISGTFPPAVLTHRQSCLHSTQQM